LKICVKSMKKLSIDEAAKYFNISKEGIHNRIRRGTLNSVVESGVKYVLLSDEKVSQNPDKFYNYLEQENGDLKRKLENLELEIKNLRDQKEQMLIDERIKIEQIYKERDRQLEVILSRFSSKTLPQHDLDETEVTEVVVEEAEIAYEQPLTHDDLVSLKDFLRLKQYSKERRRRIKKRFKKVAPSDERVIVIDKKLHLRPYHYNYSDLISD